MRQPSEPHLFVVQPPAPPEDDAGLVRAAVEGDPTAPGQIWDRYARLVRGVLRRSLGDDEVDDHVQEVFLRFFRQVDGLRKPGSLRCFLIGIAMRVAGSELRRRRVRRFMRISPSEELESGPASPRDDDAREAVRRLYAILDRVDSRTRLLFVLRYVEALELTEIAESLEVSLATTKRHLARAGDRVFALAGRDELLIAYLTRHAHVNRGAG
ncbi:MAG TPA: sigma-70 family RNA polymerase sigma factor [Polyangiaceae bacterium]|jgi:RNA polymerase sigma-70 factor (ECF subfamily)|nr:sigma-70 family RNA polymerase sigma factor [Polyangiaceae bacterium]